MKKLVAIIVLAFGIIHLSCGQHFIGLHKDEVKQLMKETNKKLHLDNSVVNNTYKYLKYTDNMGMQTMLFFLDDYDECKMIRYMCDYSLIDDKRKELDEKYTKEADNVYVYKYQRKNYEVKLEEGEWYFTITTRLQKKD